MAKFADTDIISLFRPNAKSRNSGARFNEYRHGMTVKDACGILINTSSSIGPEAARCYADFRDGSGLNLQSDPYWDQRGSRSSSGSSGSGPKLIGYGADCGACNSYYSVTGSETIKTLADYFSAGSFMETHYGNRPLSDA